MRTADVGIHLLIWGSHWSDPAFDLAQVFSTCRAAGFAGVEVPILTEAHLRAASGVRAAARAEGLWLTASTALPPGASLVEAPGRPAALRWLKAVVSAAAELGSPLLCGPMLAPVGELPAAAPRRFEDGAEGLASVAEWGAGSGVRVCVEPLNRYETDVLNTLAQGAELCALAGEGLLLLADTYHQNIEECDPLGALRAHLPWVGHVHLSENHRGPLGSGHIPWPAVWRTLQAGGYGGRAVVEGFNGRVEELARACCLWRPAATSPEAYAAASGRHLALLLAAMEARPGGGG